MCIRDRASQYVVPGVEVVSVVDGDTLTADNNRVRLERTYTITSFDENLYAIPALTVKVNGKAYQGGTAALKVITMDVDTLHPNQFFPPKDVQNLSLIHIYNKKRQHKWENMV